MTLDAPTVVFVDAGRDAGNPINDCNQLNLAERLLEMGTPVNQLAAGVLLDDLGFTKRLIEQRIACGNVPERNQPFEIIEVFRDRLIQSCRDGTTRPWQGLASNRRNEIIV